MEIFIRILTIFAGSGQLVIMFVASLIFIGMLYVSTRIFSAAKRHEEHEHEVKVTDVQQKLQNIEFKIARQIELQASKSLSNG